MTSNLDLVQHTEEAIQHFLKENCEVNLSLIRSLEDISFTLFVEENDAFLDEQLLSEEDTDQWMWDEDCWMIDSFASSLGKSEKACSSSSSHCEEDREASEGYWTSYESVQSECSLDTHARFLDSEWIVVQPDDGRDENSDWTVISGQHDDADTPTDDWTILSVSTGHSLTKDTDFSHRSDGGVEIVGKDSEPRNNNRRKHKTGTGYKKPMGDWLVVCMYNATTRRSCCDPYRANSYTPEVTGGSWVT